MVCINVCHIHYLLRVLSCCKHDLGEKKKKLPEWAPTKTWWCVLSIIDWPTVMCMGTSTICLCSIKSPLPSLYPLRHSCDKLSQALYCFFVLQVTESWAGPGNEATHSPLWQTCKVLLPRGAVTQDYSIRFSSHYWITNPNSGYVMMKCLDLIGHYEGSKLTIRGLNCSVQSLRVGATFATTVLFMG